MTGSASTKLALDHVYHWEKARANEVYMTQPMGGGKVVTFTWSEVMRQARCMAAYLRAQNFEAGSQIAIVSKNTAQWIMADLAIWMAGHVSVPVYPTNTRDEIRYVLEHSEAKLVFYGKLDDPPEVRAGIPESLPGVALPLSEGSSYPTWDELVAGNEPITDSPTRGEDDMATIVYTSGSTGRSKGAMITFGAMQRSVDGLRRRLMTYDHDRMLSYLPLAHVFERYCVEMGSFTAGFSLFFAESLDTFVQDLNRARPTMFVSVPRLWQKFQLGVFAKMPPKKLNTMLKIPILNNFVRKKVLTGLGLDQVRFAATGSAPISKELFQWYRDLGLELLEGYGMTENFCYSHASKPGEMRVGYVGPAYDDVEVRISEAGEILVKSPGSMTGYFKEPELTAAAFTEDGFLKTGDRGEIDNLGRLRITGRVKELNKTSKGKYVSPAPNETRIMAHPDVEMACVCGASQPQPCALIMLGADVKTRVGGDAAARAELQASLAAHMAAVNAELPHHEHMSFGVVVQEEWLIDNGFLTPTMKLKRSAIEDAYGQKLDGWYAAGDKLMWE